jgi:hypothetical protein
VRRLTRLRAEHAGLQSGAHHFHTLWSTGPSPRSIQAADVNEEGAIDLLVADSGSDTISRGRGLQSRRTCRPGNRDNSRATRRSSCSVRIGRGRERTRRFFIARPPARLSRGTWQGAADDRRLRPGGRSAFSEPPPISPTAAERGEGAHSRSGGWRQSPFRR